MASNDDGDATKKSGTLLGLGEEAVKATSAVAAQDEPEPAPEAPPPAPPPAAAPAPPELDQPRRPREKTKSRWTLGTALGARSAVVPGWTAGLGLYGAFSRKAIRLSTGASLWLPVQRELNDEQGAEFQLSTAYGKACRQMYTYDLTPALCTGVELSVLRAEGFGPGVEPATRTAAFATLSLGAEAFVRPSTELTLVLAADFLVPLGDRQFVFDGSDPAAIYSPGMGFQLTCGAEWSL
ncbi:MAG TPA: hypothetical protein VM686_08300 [Polyangiaceae bacterium]|nr:hypothetical protein [Polyangiaceae bacterium]